MEYLVAWLIGVALGWVVLLVVMLIAQRIADFGMPPFAEFAWRAAVVVGVTSAVGGALDLVDPDSDLAQRAERAGHVAAHRQVVY